MVKIEFFSLGMYTKVVQIFCTVVFQLRPDQLNFSFCGHNMEKSRCGQTQLK